MKIALVHEYLVKLGGAEKVLNVLQEMFPEAPIFTLLYNEKVCGSLFKREKIRVSGLQKLPDWILKKRRYLFPLMPYFMEKFDFRGYDLVISCNSAYAHGIITPVETFHICYCNSPMRYAWDWYHEYLKEQKVGGFKRAAIAYLMKKIRTWDKIASDRPDFYIANSKNVARRIKKYYRLDSKVIYPPVDVSRFQIQKKHADFFLVVATLSPYKRVDLAVELCNKLGKRLVIIGDGSERPYLEQIAGPTIDFLGFQDDRVVTEYLSNCRAVIFPGEEDFGLVPVEALACGKPVLAFGKGGVTETVRAGKTGEFFYEPTVDSLEDGLARLLNNEKNYDRELMRKTAAKFSKERFIREMKKVIEVSLHKKNFLV